jgi:hypothetical protein
MDTACTSAWYKGPRSESTSVKGMFTNNTNSKHMRPKEKVIQHMHPENEDFTKWTQQCVQNNYEQFSIFGALTQTKNEGFNKMSA